MPTKVTTGEGALTGRLETRGDEILVTDANGQKVFGRYIQDGERWTYRDSAGVTQGWIVQENGRTAFRSTQGQLSGIYEKKGDRIICRNPSDGRVFNAFESGPERDKLFGPAFDESGSKKEKKVPAIPIAAGGASGGPGCLSGCMGALVSSVGWPAYLILALFALVIGSYLSPLLIILGGLVMWFLIHQLRSNDPAVSHGTVAVCLVIVLLFEIQMIGCTIHTYGPRVFNSKQSTQTPTLQVRPQPPTEVKVSVNYDRSIADSIAAGHYDQVDPNIIPLGEAQLKKSRLIRHPKHGTESVTIYLLNFGKTLQTKDVWKEFEKAGVRPVTLQELLAVGEQRPELQRLYAIAGIGALISTGTVHVIYCPSLAGNKSVRAVGLVNILKETWGPYCRFAVVKLKNS